MSSFSLIKQVINIIFIRKHISNIRNKISKYISNDISNIVRNIRKTIRNIRKNISIKKPL